MAKQKVKNKKVKSKSKKSVSKSSEVLRTPIITILGHVDHGKTSLLDKIRGAEVQAGEAGGITQKVSVFTVDLASGKKITFIDTPGHEAFDLMRSRGGAIADIVLLIVAADDGIKPQTEESIEIIKKSKSTPIVVLNKVDLRNINVDKIKRDISVKGLQLEGFGGDIPVVELSAKTGDGIDTLLETIDVVIDVEGLVDRAGLPDQTSGKAYILESVKDPKRGFVSSLVAVDGDLKKGDWVIYRDSEDQVQMEKIKGFISEDGENIDELKQGAGGKLLGLSGLIKLGTDIYTTESKDKKLAKALFKDEKPVEDSVDAADEVDEEISEEDENARLLAEMFSSSVESDSDEDEGGSISVIVKSSSQGSLQAVVSSLEKIDVDGFVVNIVESSVGDITMKDIGRAEVTKSIILGFEIGMDANTETESRKKKVLIRTYEIMYKLVEEIQDALVMMAAPKETEEEIGKAEVKEIFVLTDGSLVVGGRVRDGMMKSGYRCYVVRDDEIVHEGRIGSLRHGKNEIKEASKGSDFGIVFDPMPKSDAILEGDFVHCFKVVK